jgi:hypothetical protein
MESAVSIAKPSSFGFAALYRSVLLLTILRSTRTAYWETQIRSVTTVTARQLRVRFRIGDSVEILSTIHSGFIGMTGTVTAVMKNVQARTLDEYTVRLQNCGEEVFWDIQLRCKPERRQR